MMNTVMKLSMNTSLEPGVAAVVAGVLGLAAVVCCGDVDEHVWRGGGERGREEG